MSKNRSKPPKTSSISLIREKKAAYSPSLRVYPSETRVETPRNMQVLFAKLSLGYTSTPIFSEECQGLSRLSPEDFVEYQHQQAYYDGLTQRYGSFLKQNYMASNYVKWVNDKIGYGLFARCDIPEKGLIGEYTGEVRRSSSFDSRSWSWNYPLQSSFRTYMPSDFSITGHRYGNELRFVNHSNFPNAEGVMVFSHQLWHLVYIAKKVIWKDEEIVVNYGRRHWRHRSRL